MTLAQSQTDPQLYLEPHSTSIFAVHGLGQRFYFNWSETEEREREETELESSSDSWLCFQSRWKFPFSGKISRLGWEENYAKVGVSHTWTRREQPPVAVFAFFYLFGF